MTQNPFDLRVPPIFLRSLQRYVMEVYQKAQAETTTLQKLAKEIEPRALWAYYSRTGEEGDQKKIEVLDRYLDYHMRALRAKSTTSRYRKAVRYVQDLKPEEIDIKHPSIAKIARHYLPRWQLRWLRQQWKIYEGFGWPVPVRPQIESLETTIEIDDYSDEEQAGEDEEDQEWINSEGDVDPKLGSYEVYSQTPVEVVPEAEDEDYDYDLIEDAPPLEDVALETLIEESPQKDLFTRIAAEYLKPDDMVDAPAQEILRIRGALYEVFKWARDNNKKDRAQMREQIDTLLDEPLPCDDPFPPGMRRHATGHGYFMQGLIQYEGTGDDEELPDIRDAV